MEYTSLSASANSFAPKSENAIDVIRQRVVEMDKRAGDILARIRALGDSAFGPIPENVTGMGLGSGPCLSGAVEELASTISRIEEALTRL